MPIIKNCINCKNEYNVKPLKADKSKFCCLNCKNEYNRLVSFCKICNTQITDKKCLDRKFCSRTCYIQNRSSGKEHECEKCGKLFFLIKSRREKNAKFCSIKCYSDRHWNNNERSCTKCGEKKTSSEFKRPFSKKQTYRADCRTCYLSAASDRQLKKAFNLTRAEYDNILVNQNGRCAVCKQEPTKKKLAVDHCHESGKIRGLLCDRCNQGLGMFKDKPEYLQNAIKYLQT